MIRTFILMFKRHKFTKELNNRDLKNFKDITEYIGMSSLSPIEQEVVFQQILDMMLHAKSQGKFASEAIGYDIKGFCDSIIKESTYNKSIFHIGFNYVEFFLQTGLIYFLMMFIFNLIANGWNNSFKNQDVFYMDIVTFVPMFIVMFPLSFMIRRKQIFKRKNKKDYSWVFLAICIFLASSVSDMIRNKFQQLASIPITPYENKILLLIIFLIAFRRDICYLIKSISRKLREKQK